MTPNEKAEGAKRVLNDPVISAAMADIRMGLVGKLEQLPMSDTESQHEIALTLQLLKQLKLQLETYGQDAAVDKAVRRQETFMQRMRGQLA